MLSRMLVLTFLFVIGSTIDAKLLGKFVFESSEQEHGSFLSVLHQPDSVMFTPSPGAIKAEEVSSILSLSLGSSVPKDISWSGLQFGDLFNRPQAAVMISVDGLPKDSKIKMPSTQNFPLKMDDAATLADVYSIQSGFSLAGHVNALYDGKSTTLSTAQEEGIAVSGNGAGEHSQTVFWNKEAENWQQMKGAEGDSELFLKKSEIIKTISEDYLYNKEDSTVTLNIKGFQVNFNMDDDVDFELFSELVVIQHQIQQLQAKKESFVDGVPDVFMFSISALKGIERKYGGDSKQMHGALYLIEKFIPKVIDDFKQMYNGNVLIVGITLTSQMKIFETHHSEIKSILDTLKHKADFVTDAFSKFIPELHIPSHITHLAQQTMCEELQGSMAKFTGILKFKCHNNHPDVHKLTKRSLLADDDKAEKDYNLDSFYDEDFPVIFNMWFWLIVILAITVYAISVAMWNMDPGDSIIYRLTQQKIKAE